MFRKMEGICSPFFIPIFLQTFARLGCEADIFRIHASIAPVRAKRLEERLEEAAPISATIIAGAMRKEFEKLRICVFLTNQSPPFVKTDCIECRNISLFEKSARFRNSFSNI